MARVKIRALCLTLLASACFAPAANAAVADSLLPFYDAADGVRVVKRPSGEYVIRFDAKAARIYRTIAGKRTEIGCGWPARDGDALSGGGGSVSTGHRIPRRRGPVRLGISDDIQYCWIATRRNKRESCLQSERTSDQCVRVAVALRPEGAAYLDRRARTIELAFASTMLGAALTPEFKVPGKTTLERMRTLLGPDVVELATPEDSPPAGTLGYWSQGESFAIAVLLADGTRRFVRIQDGVFSTNDLELTGLDSDDVFTLS
jgi:hypothetical protein